MLFDTLKICVGVFAGLCNMTECPDAKDITECPDDEDIPIIDDPNTQATVPCDDCEGTEDVFSYCLDCHGALCDKCKESHQRKKMTRSHKIVPYSDPKVEYSKNIAAFEKCSKHPDNAMISFCEKCQHPCCVYCVSTDHKLHDTKGINDKISYAKVEIEQYIKTHESTISALSEDIAKSEQDIVKEIADAEKAENQLDSALKDVHAAVDKEGIRLRGVINIQKKTNINGLNLHISLRKGTKFQCENIVRQSRQALQSNAPELLKFQQIKSLPIKYNSVKKLQPSVSMKTGKINVANLTQMIGEVHISNQGYNETASGRCLISRQDTLLWQLGRRCLTAYPRRGPGPFMIDNEVYYDGKLFSTAEWSLIQNSSLQ